MSPFENAFQIRTHRFDEESNDENEGSSLKSIGRVHLSQLMKTALPQCAVATARSKVVNYVRDKGELASLGAVIVRVRVVSVIKAKFWTNRN